MEEKREKEREKGQRNQWWLSWNNVFWLQNRELLFSGSCPTLLRHHGLQPTRLLCPWDLPGKSTGVGCHFLLQGNLPDPEIELTSPALSGGFFPTAPHLNTVLPVSSVAICAATLVEWDLEKWPQKEFQLLSLVVEEKMTVAGIYDVNRTCNSSVWKSQKVFFQYVSFVLFKRIRKGCGIDSFQKSNVVFQLTVPINTCILVISHVLDFTWKRESKCRSPKARGHQV